MDAAILPRLERLLAEFDELKVTDKALPALGRNPGRINSPGGTTRTTATRCAIRICAVHCTWYAEGGGDRDCFRRVYKMEAIPVPTPLRVPGAVYCADADCTA